MAITINKKPAFPIKLSGSRGQSYNLTRTVSENPLRQFFVRITDPGVSGRIQWKREFDPTICFQDAFSPQNADVNCVKLLNSPPANFLWDL